MSDEKFDFERKVITLDGKDLSKSHGLYAMLWSNFIKPFLILDLVLVIEIRKDTRSLAQNRIMWSIMADLARQVEWPVDGRTQKLSPDDWKEIITAGVRKGQRVAAGIEGGFVMLGARTSSMTKKELADVIECAYAFGAQRGVKWSRTSLSRDIPDEVIW